MEAGRGVFNGVGGQGEPMAVGAVVRAVEMGAQDLGVAALGEPVAGQREEQRPVGDAGGIEREMHGRLQAGQVGLDLGRGQRRLGGEEFEGHWLAGAGADFLEHGPGFLARAAGRLPEQGSRSLATLGGHAGQGAEQRQLSQGRGAAQRLAERGADGVRQFVRRMVLTEGSVQVNHERATIIVASPPPKPIRLSMARLIRAVWRRVVGCRPISGSGSAKPAVAGIRSASRQASRAASSATPLAPSVWPSAGLSESSGGMAEVKTRRSALASARSVPGEPAACSLSSSMAVGANPASSRQAVITAASGPPSGSGPVIDQASIPVRSPAMRQGAGVAERRTAATASPRTSPSRRASNGRLAVGESSSIAAKPASVRSLASSLPTTTASSIWPAAIRLRATSMAEKPEMQALDRLWRGPASCSQPAMLRLNSA